MLRYLRSWWESSPHESARTSHSQPNLLPPKKRRRIEIEDGNDDQTRSKGCLHDIGPILRPDLDNWKSDGDVIIATYGGQEGEGIICKCHAWQLSKSSSVFMDLFALPQPAMIEHFEGVPLVRLPDKHSNFRVILRMLYDEAYSPCRTHAADLVHNVAGPLRMMDKYQMDDLHARLVKTLTNDWPATLEDWVKREEKMDRENSKPWVVTNRTEMDVTLADRIAVMRLAEEAGLTAILPPVLYELNRIYLTRLCNAEISHSQYSHRQWLQIPLNFDYQHPVTHHDVPNELRLNAGELHRLLVGREFIRSRAMWFLSVDLAHAMELTYHFRTRTCEPAMYRWQAEVLERECARQVIFTDPLKVLGEMEHEIMQGSRNPICERCRVQVRDALEECRLAIWRDLPRYFNITKDSEPSPSGNVDNQNP
ncbi:hypothetical protein NM688_g6842 [Phlebia brevispora]|uniref:Uncharacterized protein n=1 Tax=Phlebia brevispora TaxID=194682 RepID=A0ACC1SBY3_9APHY|nr:hypothetical protein NM688_g6842 [Phlebia brevispora]